MPVPTQEAITFIQAFIDQTSERLAALDLHFTVEDDFLEWRELLEHAADGEPISATLDPTLNYVAPAAGFWIAVRDKNNKIVACAGVRHIETSDFIQEFVATQRLFGDRRPKVKIEPISFAEPPPKLKGRIGFGGGSWVHKSVRGHNLAGVTSQLWRCIGLRHFSLDYCVGFTAATLRRTRWGRETLGWPHQRQLLTGFYPGRGKPLDVNILWASASEIIVMCRGKALTRGKKRRLQRVG